MSSARETALQALFGALGAALSGLNPPPILRRNETIPQRLPPGGLVVLRDGETVEETAILSPLAWQIEHRAELEVIAASSEALDALLVAIGAALVADRTLGGAVEWTQPGSPTVQDVEVEGIAAARAASVPVTLTFTVAGSPLT